MSGAIRRLEAFARQKESLLQKIILRSAHSNGMGFKHSMCHPMDGRTLPNADVATSILKEIAEEFSSPTTNNSSSTDQEATVSFVDTNFLLHPVWDSQLDYSHYEWDAGMYEFKFIISKSLQEEWG